MEIKNKLSLKGKASVLILFFICLCAVFNLTNQPSRARVKLSIFSSSLETFQLFWQTEEYDYSQKRSSIARLKPGSHEYHFRIGSADNIRRLRLDPSVRKSTMAIERLSLEWDGEPVFELSGEAFKNALSPVQGVALEFDKQNNRVVVNSTGIDPIVEIDTTQLIAYFSFFKFLKQGGMALLYTIIFMFPLLYLCSEWYIGDSHCTYPGKKSHWVYWGGIFLILGMYLTIVTPVHLIDSNPILHFAAISYLTGALLFIPAFWFATRKLEYTIPGQPARFSWFWFALPSFVIWSFYLLSFWPGSMSPDSLDQWKQILNGHLKDWHPAFHTMNIWLITRIKLSPATVVIVQILALGSTAGWALTVFQRFGVSKTVLWFTSLFFALLPVNGLMVVTLWKDMAYSIVLLILAVYIFQIVMQKGLWLACRKNWVLLGGVLALVSLYRHNGVIPAFSVSILLFCCYLKYWRGIVFATMIALLIHAGVRGPLYDALEVRRGNPMTHIQQKLKSDLFSTLVAKSNNDQRQKVIQESVGQQSKNHLEGKREDRQYSGKVWDRIFSASVVWRIKRLDFFHKRYDYVNLWTKKRDKEIIIKYVSSNKIGISQNSLTPTGEKFLYGVFDQSRSNKYLFWMWRPAVYLYALSGLLILLSWRFRKKMYLIIVPPLVNSLPMFLVVINKSVFRYHYSIVLLCIVTILPLLFLKSVQEEEQPGKLI